MEDQVPIMVIKTQFFLPRKLRRTMNFFWAFNEPKNPAIEAKVRKMKRNILHRASICAKDVYYHWREFIEDKDKLGGLKSLEDISDQMQAGICTPKKLRNAIYNRMLEEAADIQFAAAEKAAAAQQFIHETVVAAQRAKQAATAAVAAKDATAAVQFANEAAEAAKLAKEAAESAQLANRTKETFENAKLARKAAAAAEFAKKSAAAAQLAEDEVTPVAVLEEKLGKLLLSEDCGGDECKRDNCNCKGKARGARDVIKKLTF